jgi:hypothetical protein
MVLNEVRGRGPIKDYLLRSPDELLKLFPLAGNSVQVANGYRFFIFQSLKVSRVHTIIIFNPSISFGLCRRKICVLHDYQLGICTNKISNKGGLKNSYRDRIVLVFLHKPGEFSSVAFIETGAN